MRLCISIALLISLASACSGGDEESSATPGAASLPVAVMSAAEVQKREADALAFAGRFNEAHPDSKAVFAEFTDDSVTMDPSHDDLFDDRDAVIAAWKSFGEWFPDLDARPTSVYLSADAAAVLTDAYNLADLDGPLHEIRLYRFDGDLATSLEFWYLASDLQLMRFACFAGEECPAQARRLADHYLAAWSSDKESEIAALYSDGAAFSDSMLGIEATGSSEIAGLKSERFGSMVDSECSGVDLYAQTIGDDGPLYGVSIVYHCTLTAGGDSRSIDGIANLQLGSVQGSSYRLDPSGLVAHEEVFHDAGSLITAGIAR